MPKSINKGKAYKKLVEEYKKSNIIKQKYVAEIFDRDRVTIYRWTISGEIIPPIYINGHNKGWKKDDLICWLIQL